MDGALKNIEGFEITFHEKSKRIINIKIEDQIIERLIFPFKKFDVTALEYKPFTRFTIAKSLDDISSGKLGDYINSILKNRNTGCFIIGPKNLSSKINQIMMQWQVDIMRDFMLSMMIIATHI